MVKSMSLKSIILVAISLIFFLGLYLFYYTASEKSVGKKGFIIILNGPSCSGKSTLQLAIQDIFDQAIIRAGIDKFFYGTQPFSSSWFEDMDLDKVDFFALFPEGLSIADQKRIMSVRQQRFGHTNELIRTSIKTTDDQGHSLFILKFGPVAHNIIFGMHRAIKAYADAGCNVVVDYILYEDIWLDDLVKVLKDYKVYFIKMHISLEELEKREEERRSTPKGHARSHYKNVYGPDVYDLIVDSENCCVEEMALQVKNFVSNNPNPKAFKKIYELRCK